MGWLDYIRGAFSGTTPTPTATPVTVQEPPPPAPFPPKLLVAVGVSVSDAARYAGPLSDAALRHQITTVTRRAMFLATVLHESAMLRYKREIWGPTQAQLRYEGRAGLGNTQPGDGYLFRGRGFIQTTGRANYQILANSLGMTLANVAAYLESDVGACESAALFWYTHGCNASADAGDFVGVTKRVNGGLNGITQRFALLDKIFHEIA